MRFLSFTFLLFSFFFSVQSSGHGFDVIQFNTLNDSLSRFVANSEYQSGIRFCNTAFNDSDHPTIRRFLLINKARLFIKSKTHIDSVPVLHKQQSEYLHNNDSLDTYLSARSLEILGYYYYYSGDYKQAILTLNRADSAYGFSKSISERVYNLNMIGTINSFQNDFADALMAFLLAEEIVDLNAERIETSTAVDLFIDLGMLYFKLNEYDKAERYFKRLSRYTVSKEQEADIDNNRGILYLQTGRHEQAIKYLRQAKQLYKSTENLSDLSKAYNNLALAFYETNYTSDSIEYYFNQSIHLKKELNDKRGLVKTYTGLLSYFYKNSRYEEVEEQLNALLMQKAYCATEDWQSYYLYKALLAEHEGSYQTAYDNYRIYHSYADSINNSQNINLVKQTETNFLLNKKQSQLELAKKETELANAKADHRKSSIVLILILSITALLFLIILLYTYAKRNERTKQELKTEIKYEAVKNLVLGQEKERLRIAKELHDGVGSQLALLKAETSKPQNLIDPDQLNKIVTQTATDIRNVSHDLMPYAIEKLGLEAAIKELALRWQKNYLDLFLDVNVCLEGVHLSNRNALTIYRIIQELIRNSIIHGEASFILINLFNKANGLELTIEDNGKGMDESIWIEGKGTGIENVKNRIAYLNGQVIFNSSNSGTRYQISFLHIS